MSKRGESVVFGKYMKNLFYTSLLCYSSYQWGMTKDIFFAFISVFILLWLTVITTAYEVLLGVFRG